MFIRRNETQIVFGFERKEWNIANGDAVKNFIADLKERVPREYRDYDSSLNEWTVRGAFVSVVDELREKHFVDHNQASLF